MRVVGIVQARMSSSRLPGKMAAEIFEGRTTLECLLERLKRSTGMDHLVVATSDRSEDDQLAATTVACGVAVYRGSLNDVLGRVAGCALESSADAVVELTGDCPLICPEVIDRVINEYRHRFPDNRIVANNFVSEFVHSSYPKGQDVRVFSAADLKQVALSSHDPAHREHPTLHFFERPDIYRPYLVAAPPQYNRPDWRLLLDYPEDLTFIREVYRRLYPLKPAFALDDLFDLFERAPELLVINSNLAEKPLR